MKLRTTPASSDWASTSGGLASQGCKSLFRDLVLGWDVKVAFGKQADKYAEVLLSEWLSMTT